MQSLSRGQDYIENIARMLGDLQGTRTVVYELLQNADDAPGATKVRFTVSPEHLEIWNDGLFDKCDDVTTLICGWLADRGHRCDFHSFRTLSSGDKQARPGTTGAFGIGFTAVYQLTDRPELLSNGEHWFIDELDDQDERIKRTSADSSYNGTTFRLPWAAAPSVFRKRLRQTPISQEFVDHFAVELEECVPSAMLFLKRIESIEVRSSGHAVTFARKREDDVIHLTSSSGSSQSWFVLEDSFEEMADDLKERYPDVIERLRSSKVLVALPLGPRVGEMGRLYATLPTDETLSLPILINADFYPASDRKRIRFDTGGFTEWNRAAVRAAAKLLAANLESLPEILGDKAVVSLVRGASDLHAAAHDGGADSSYRLFWDHILSALDEAAVVPTISGTYGTTREVRLWSDPSEGEAGVLLNGLGIDLVSTDVRREWFQLRSGEVGIDVLHLRDVVAALVERGAIRRWTSWHPQSGLRGDSMPIIWDLLEFLLSVKDRSDEASRVALRGCAVVPGPLDLYSAASDARMAPADIQFALRALGINLAFADESRLASTSRVFGLVDALTPNELVYHLSVGLPRRTIVDPSAASDLLRWFNATSADLDADNLSTLAAIPIFPTPHGPRPIDELALPGNFVDPLGLSSIVDLEGIEEMRPFLQRLGAQPLTLAKYCTSFLAPAFKGSELQGARRRKAVRLLAQRVFEIEPHEDVRRALSQVALVTCIDDSWRLPIDVYLSPDVIPLVGDDVAIAKLPAFDREAHATLFEWLGATRTPRPSDLERRCKQLSRGGPSHRATAQAIIEYGSNLQNRDEPASKAALAALAGLRDINWLPVEGETHRGHVPSSVWFRFRKNIFASQAKFLDISVVVERECADFLRWLGLRQEPSSNLVVGHLLKCAAANEPVGEDLWAFLDQHADDAELDALEGKPCLLLQESQTYVRPDQVYWGPHEFGRWRFSLGGGFSKHRRLLDRLKVPEGPDPKDAIEVLLDIASRHGGEASKLLDEDVLVVGSCWRMLSQAIDNGIVTSNDLQDLASAEVVLDSSDLPRQPGDVYFRDSVTLADHFGSEVQPRLIDRPEGMWVAMSEAGVKNLSDAVVTTVVEQELLGGGGMLPGRLVDLERALVRVLSKDDPSAVARLRSFLSTDQLVRVGTLVIQQTIAVGGTPFTSKVFARDALYLRNDGHLLWVDRKHSEPAWVEVSRELVRAIEVDDGVASSVAGVFTMVLRSQTTQEAHGFLDELGFPALDRSSNASAAPRVSKGFATADGDVQGEVPSEDTGYYLERPDELTSPVSATRQVERREELTKNEDDNDNKDAAAQRTDVQRPSTGCIETRTTSKPATQPVKAPVSQNRLRSYVVPKAAAGTSAEPGGVNHNENVDDIDRAAVQAVVAYEVAHGREITVMPHDNPGYDVRSEHPDGEVRFIEVKGTAVRWGDQGVGISSRQYFEGQQRRDAYWLYVVDEALTAPTVYPIQDPISMIDQYLFDDGWRAISEQADVTRPALPQLKLSPSRMGVDYVPLHDSSTLLDEGKPLGWMLCQDPKRRDDWFAVRVPGYSLGLASRGGVVFVEPLDRKPEDDDLLLVSLHDQSDPDTESSLAIRLWLPERDLAGNELAVRLWSQSSVAPLTVLHPEQLVIHGQVIGKPLTATDLKLLKLL